MILALALALIVAGCVFLHGQGFTGWWSGKIRIPTTILVTAIITYASYHHFPHWQFIPAVILSTAWAFDWGPEIGWGERVMWTQAAKGLWLAAALFPFGIAYAIARPFSYWVGYTKYISPVGSNLADEVSRSLSGLFLGSIVFAALVA